jgi:hypothetical protein
VFDSTTGEGDALRSEFACIPDGRQPSLASKHVPAKAPTEKKPPRGGGKKDKQPQPKKAASPTKTGVDQVHGKDLSCENDNVKDVKGKQRVRRVGAGRLIPRRRIHRL